MKFILKIDQDLKVPEEWIEKWKISRVALLKSLGIEVKEIITQESKRGYHHWIHCESKKELSDEEINMLQFLCGDDPGRVYINSLRIKRGVKNWNKLFSKVLWRKAVMPLIFISGEGEIFDFKKIKSYRLVKI